MGHKKIVRIDPCEKALPNGGIDSHAHLDDEKFASDLDSVLLRAKKCGLSNICNVFLDPNCFDEKKHIFDNHPEVFFIMGLHPCDGEKCTESVLEKLEISCLKDSRIRAIGEIGLDYYWKDCPKEVQHKAFISQLHLAKKLNLPVVIHCREAESDCLEILEKEDFINYSLLWHCFGGNWALAKKIVDNGWFISIPGPITFPANEGIRESLSYIPEDKLLFETDAPYLSPIPWRGTRNEPAYTVFTVHVMAQVLNKSPEDLWIKCGDNARRFFNLPS